MTSYEKYVCIHKCYITTPYESISIKDNKAMVLLILVNFTLHTTVCKRNCWLDANNNIPAVYKLVRNGSNYSNYHGIYASMRWTLVDYNYNKIMPTLTKNHIIVHYQKPAVSHINLCIIYKNN